MRFSPIPAKGNKMSKAITNKLWNLFGLIPECLIPLIAIVAVFVMLIVKLVSGKSILGLDEYLDKMEEVESDR